MVIVAVTVVVEVPIATIAITAMEAATTATMSTATTTTTAIAIAIANMLVAPADPRPACGKNATTTPIIMNRKVAVVEYDLVPMLPVEISNAAVLADPNPEVHRRLVVWVNKPPVFDGKAVTEALMEMEMKMEVEVVENDRKVVAEESR